MRTWRQRYVGAWTADPRAIARTISAIVADPSLARGIAGHARAWGEHMAWGRWVGAYQKILRGAEVTT